MARRFRHNLSSQRLMTGDMGTLMPCGLVEVLPGDEFRGESAVLIRMAPMAAPVMHSMVLRVHHFFVPHRLTWQKTPGEGGTFEDFITGGPDGADTQKVPQTSTTGVRSDLHDYFGNPVVAGLQVSALPIRAYNLIYNEWFRDQDLITPRDIDETSVANVAYE